MSLSAIDQRLWAKVRIIKAIDDSITEMIRNQIEVLSFDERFALIEQRNRIAKIFGHNQRGLASYLK